MFRFIRYLRNYKKESLVGPLFKLLEACFELMVPLVVSRIVDVGIVNRDVTYIIKMCGIMIAFSILGMVCSVTAQYFAAKAATGFGAGLRADLFAHINRLDYTQLDEVGTATLVTRMTSDINQTEAGVNLALRLFLRSPFIVAGSVFLAFTIDTRLAFIFVILVVILSAVIFAIMYTSIPLYRKVQQKLEKVLLLTREGLAGARVVRAFSRQADELQAFEEESRILMKLQLLVGKISALLNPATYLVINAAVIVLLWQGAARVNVGGITQGELIALINYMSQILLSLIVLASFIISITKASASAKRINEVFARTSNIKEALQFKPEAQRPRKAAGNRQRPLETAGQLPANTEHVKFSHVDFAYRGGKNALTDINFSAARGQTIGIIGGTGSGKSTVINLIPRFYDVSAGQVLVNGSDVKEYPFVQLRGKIGIVPQTAVLFAGTVRENLQWRKRDATDKEIYHALELAQAGEFLKEKNGLDTEILQGGKNFSGGQRQRLTIARALVGEPEILILDDSASALDFVTDARLRRAIAVGLPQTTIFMVSQRATTIKSADQILVLDEGKLCGLGTHEKLLKTCEVYLEICKSQLTEKELQQS